MMYRWHHYNSCHSGSPTGSLQSKPLPVAKMNLDAFGLVWSGWVWLVLAGAIGQRLVRALGTCCYIYHGSVLYLACTGPPGQLHSISQQLLAASLKSPSQQFYIFHTEIYTTLIYIYF